MKRDYYLVCYRLGSDDHYLLWYSDETHEVKYYDRVVLDEAGNLQIFATRYLATAYAYAHDLPLSADEPPFYRLDYIAQWCRSPRASRVNCRHFNGAWNLFTDVARSVGADFDTHRKHTDRIYHKLFCGMNLPSLTPEGHSYEPIWSRKELNRLCEVMRSGLRLIRQ